MSSKDFFSGQKESEEPEKITFSGDWEPIEEKKSKKNDHEDYED